MGNQEPIRTFIAVELNEQTRRELGQLQKRMLSASADVKWVDPENMHLTLKFLGNITQEEVNKATKILDAVSTTIHPFTISISDVGAFPNASNPRVIWVGIDRGKEQLVELYTRIEDGLAGEDFQKDERPFSPHLTVGRVRGPKNKDKLKAAITNETFVSDDVITVDRVILFRSDLKPSGPVYTQIHSAQFRG
jgi:2'-5' RNA ligase